MNFGGTGKLPMTDLKRLGEDAGFAKVRTFIASGNLLFESDLDEQKVKAAIEDRLEEYAGRRIPVLVRTHAEMAAVAAANPFADEPPNWTVAIFLDASPASDALASVTNQQDEKLALGKREIYVAYGAGMGRSKLRVPAAGAGTARNMNSVRKLAELSAAL